MVISLHRNELENIMNFEDADIVEVNDNDGIELTLSANVTDDFYIYITDKELLQLCKMRGLID